MLVLNNNTLTSYWNCVNGQLQCGLPWQQWRPRGSLALRKHLRTPKTQEIRKYASLPNMVLKIKVNKVLFKNDK